MSDCIPPEIGKRYTMRDGDITWYIRANAPPGNVRDYPLTDGHLSWKADGSYLNTETITQQDIVAEYTPIEAPLAPRVVKAIEAVEEYLVHGHTGCNFFDTEEKARQYAEQIVTSTENATLYRVRRMAICAHSVVWGQ
jgi:hypothetical protein